MIMIKPKRIRKKRYLIHSFRKIIVQDLDLVLIPFQMKRDLDRGHLKKVIRSIKTEAEAGKINSHIGPTIESANQKKMSTGMTSKGIEEPTRIAVETEKITKTGEIVEIEEIIEIIGIIGATMGITDTVVGTDITIKTEITNLRNRKFQNKFQCQLKFQCQMKEL